MRLFLRYLFLVSLSLVVADGSVAGGGGEEEEDSFVLVGVSGTLQDGFELRNRLDYYEYDKDPGSEEFVTRSVPARLVGTALVRGYKAYLDIKPPGYREYKAEPYPPKVPNPVIIPTGCYHDANIYWLYLVKSQQVLHILAGEPRFLSITPDTGLVDLKAAETSDAVRQLALGQIQKHGFTNTDVFALPLVTGVWFDAASFVESPPAYLHEDGTRVTSYADSLALWTGVQTDDLLVVAEDDDGDGEGDTNMARRSQAWDAVYDKIRTAEADTFRRTKYPTMCRDENNDEVGGVSTRLGVSADMLRFPEVTQKDIVLAELTPDARDEL
eukprot:scaffold5684_cov169-Amphora_coffeaeformis.AAC.20